MIDDRGQYSLRLGEGPDQPVTPEELAAKMRAFVEQNPQLPVFVAADRDLRYQNVMEAMELLQGPACRRPR